MPGNDDRARAVTRVTWMIINDDDRDSLTRSDDDGPADSHDVTRLG